MNTTYVIEAMRARRTAGRRQPPRTGPHAQAFAAAREDSVRFEPMPAPLNALDSGGRPRLAGSGATVITERRTHRGS